MSVRLFDSSRAVEVTDPKYGSGYLISARLVLTSGHVSGGLGGACTIRARDEDGKELWNRLGKIVWSPWREGGSSAPANDVALVELETEVNGLEPVALGQLPSRHMARDVSKLAFQLYGWPNWAMTARPDGQLSAGGRQIEGYIQRFDTSADNLLVLNPERSGSNWQGISGAAVVCEGIVVAVQRHQQNPDRQDSLEAVPLAAFVDDPQFREILTSHGVTWAQVHSS